MTKDSSTDRLGEQLTVMLVGVAKNSFDAGFDAGQKGNYDGNLDIKEAEQQLLDLITKASANRAIEELELAFKELSYDDPEYNTSWFKARLNQLKRSLKDEA